MTELTPGRSHQTESAAAMEAAPGAKAALDEAHIKVGLRGDGVRMSTHVYTTEDDVERAVAVLQTLVTG